MNAMDTDLLGFYRDMVSKQLMLIESLAAYAPEHRRGEVLDLVATGKSIMAAAERVRERSMVPGLDDLADYTGELGNE